MKFLQFEVTKRARHLYGDEFAAKIEGLLQDGIFIEVTRGVIAKAIDASIEHKLTTADSLFYATALEYDSTLWTQDKHFQGLPRVKYFEKSV